MTASPPVEGSSSVPQPPPQPPPRFSDDGEIGLLPLNLYPAEPVKASAEVNKEQAVWNDTAADGVLLQELVALLARCHQAKQNGSIVAGLPNDIRLALTQMGVNVPGKAIPGKAVPGKADEQNDLEMMCVEDEAVQLFSTVSTIVTELLLLFLVYPGIVLLVCLTLGTFLALVEGWNWKTGFEYMVSITCGLANPLGQANNVSPSTGTGMTMAGVSGLWALGLTGILGGWSSNTKFVNYITETSTKLFRRVGDGTIAEILFSVFAISPCMLGLFVLLCGCLLAWAEGWRWSNGGFYILANVAGLPNPLIQSTPRTPFGKFFDAIISAWCFVLGGVVIGLASNLPTPDSTALLNFFHARYCRKRSVVSIDDCHK